MNLEDLVKRGFVGDLSETTKKWGKNMNQEDKGKFVRKYFERLTASDYVGIIEMFEEDGWVDSPS